MQQQEVLELIETVVRPLRQKIQHLEKQNQQLRIQMSSMLNNHHENQPRMRSRSREELKNGKKEEVRDVRSPSSEKKDKKPAWGYGRPTKGENNAVYKSPPPVEKNKYKQVAAKITTRYDSKEKNNKPAPASPNPPKKEEVKYLSFQKQASEKKIVGGQKFSENGSVNGYKHSESGSIKGGFSNQLNSNGVNPENNSRASDHLLSEEGGNQVEA